MLEGNIDIDDVISAAYYRMISKAGHMREEHVHRKIRTVRKLPESGEILGAIECSTYDKRRTKSLHRKRNQFIFECGLSLMLIMTSALYDDK